jgi:hypothetical protein
MALVTYLIGACSGGPAILVDFDSSSLPAVNGNYYLTFTGATAEGCYDIIDNAEPNTGTDTVLTMSVDYTDCTTCQAVVTPTPTVTQTPTRTPSVTPTITPTTTLTATQTQTPTPSTTTTLTASQTQTPTPTTTLTLTASQTQTQTPTPTQTGTPPATPTNTPTPSPTPFYSGISVNEFYEYTAGMLGSFSGGTLPPGTEIPYAQYVSDKSNGETIQVVQLNAISLGGQYGLNN